MTDESLLKFVWLSTGVTKGHAIESLITESDVHDERENKKALHSFKGRKTHIHIKRYVNKNSHLGNLRLRKKKKTLRI